MSNKDKIKQLHRTIDTNIKAYRKIQKEKVDENIMREELSQEELQIFHKQ
jgi:hypothetical protein